MASHHDVSYRLLSRQSTAPCLYSKRLEDESIQFRICQEAQTHISRIGKNRAFHMLQLLCNTLINSSGFQRQHLPQHQCSDQSRYRRHRCTLSVPKSATFFFTQLMKRGEHRSSSPISCKSPLCSQRGVCGISPSTGLVTSTSPIGE